MSASGSTRLAVDGTTPSPFVASVAVSGARDRAGEQAPAGTMLWSGIGFWIGLLTIAGFVGLYPQLSRLWEIWTTDPLRSIGIIILPVSLALIIHVWRQSSWELRGSWWGLLLVATALAPAIFGRHLDFFWAVGGVKINFIPSVLPLYLYAGGILLLFAGVSVWRKAWFPLALLLCVQPVPDAFVQFLDLPMQGFCAHIARSFAILLGFPPTDTELLRLMFAPNFGMFIAPGCDGMRGAVTLGYSALIFGYLKRLSFPRWSFCAAGALLLGHLFNLVRLCALVLYYRAAMGHALLESAAKRADYVIGGVLFLLAASLVLWIILRNEGKAGASAVDAECSRTLGAGEGKSIQWRAAVLALLVLIAMAAVIRTIRISSESLALAFRRGEITATELNARMPLEAGAYKLVRVWQEEQAGVLVLQAGAFERASSGEIELGIWLGPSEHSIQQSLITHGETPKTRGISQFSTASGRIVQFNTALYDDGVADTLTGDTYCSPASCQPSFYKLREGVHLAITRTPDQTARGQRVIPIFFKMQAPHGGRGSEAAHKELSSECEAFLSHLDLKQLSQNFQ